MSVTLGTNIASLKVGGQLARTTDRVRTVFERLSSGQRINGAADDPAGLAVASTLEAQVRIANQARRNVSDGVSLLQIADGALKAVSSLETRKAELAEQAANGTLSREQRTTLQAEYTALDLEIRRIARTTEFNGISLLQGEKATAAPTALAATSISNSFFHLDISGNGRYAVYINSATASLEQLDLDTNEVTVIASGAPFGSVSQSAGGEKVVFASAQNLTGEDPNGWGQVYVWDRTSGEIEQISQQLGPSALTNQDLTNIEISADGSTVMFESTTRYNPDGSTSYAAANLTVVAVNLETGIYRDANIAMTGGGYAHISADGSYVAFTSTSDITGENGDGNEEIFRFETADPSGTLQQLTVSTGVNITLGVQVDDDGNTYFASALDFIGQNASGAYQLYQYNQSMESLQQLTNAVGSGVALDRISADGSSAYVRGNADLLGENPGGYGQLYEVDLVYGGIRQLTDFSENHIQLSGRVAADGNGMIQRSASGRLEYIDFRQEDSSIQIEAGSGEEGLITTLLGDVRSVLSGVGGMLITSEGSARQALDTAIANLDNLSQLTGIIGAGLSRLESANRTLAGVAEQKTAARSRIVDADIAQETAELVKSQILQQVSTTLLRQTNASPEIALQLLAS